MNVQKLIDSQADIAEQGWPAVGPLGRPGIVHVPHLRPAFGEPMQPHDLPTEPASGLCGGGGPGAAAGKDSPTRRP